MTTRRATERGHALSRDIVHDGSASELSPAARMTELAALLARAALRLHARAALSPQHGPTDPACGETSGDPGQSALDLSAETRLHGGRVVDGPERARDGGTP